MSDNGYCPQCGKPLQENANFCIYCMTSLDEKQNVESDTPKRSKKAIVIAIVVAVVLAVIVASVAAIVLHSKKSKTDLVPVAKSDSQTSEGIYPTRDECVKLINKAYSDNALSDYSIVFKSKVGESFKYDLCMSDIVIGEVLLFSPVDENNEYFGYITMISVNASAPMDVSNSEFVMVNYQLTAMPVYAFVSRVYDFTGSFQDFLQKIKLYKEMEYSYAYTLTEYNVFCCLNKQQISCMMVCGELLYESGIKEADAQPQKASGSDNDGSEIDFNGDDINKVVSGSGAYDAVKNAYSSNSSSDSSGFSDNGYNGFSGEDDKGNDYYEDNSGTTSSGGTTHVHTDSCKEWVVDTPYQAAEYEDVPIEEQDYEYDIVVFNPESYLHFDSTDEFEEWKSENPNLQYDVMKKSSYYNTVGYEKVLVSPEQKEEGHWEYTCGY